ncbi:AAA family ATPase [Hymenobacter antarcticus]|uniref:AAA family ATPase n=1 Tax=Hymenobacter antarcticus TaxID=486270 RepID=A0ABP7Q583_9BACT
MKTSFKLPRLQIRELSLIGIRKNYEVKFRDGLNIILGDSDTGKSSILNLISYMLGGKTVDEYPEIRQAATSCQLEIKVNGRIYTIVRDIFDNKKEIEVYHSPISGILDVFPVKYYPTFTPQGELGYYSDFLLEALAIPKLELKVSPSKQDSKMSRLSFRDVFKYCYLTQDEVGSRTLLSSNNSEYSVRVKNQEVFKYLFNILDSNIAELNKALSEQTKSQNELAKKHKTISAFLRDTQVESETTLDNSLISIHRKGVFLQVSIDELHESMVSDSGQHHELRISIAKEDQQLQKIVSETEFNNISIRNNASLRKDYQQDINRIKSSIEAIEKIHGDTQHEFSCPLCSSMVSVNSRLVVPNYQ